MATTTNYGWAEPDNTSLVKNGAQDIRILGDAIDASVWNIGYGQAGKNKVINGAFNNWQRGTSFTAPAVFAYTADRWQTVCNGTIGSLVVSQQAFTAGTAPVAGYEGTYFLRQLTTGQSGGSVQAIAQRIEDVRTFANQTITFSFWAKADTSRNWTCRFIQSFGSGGSGDVSTANSSNFAVTTSWQRFSATFTLASIAGKTIGAGSYLYAIIDGPVNTGQTMDIWGVQVEAGSIATPFQTASGGSPQAELAMCQRYYWRSTASAAYSRLTNSGYGQSATAITIPLVNPVEMRTQATTLDYGGTVGAYDGTNITNCTAVTLDSSSSPKISVIAGTVASGLTQYRPYGFIANNSSTAYIGLSAEL
jgi:hypothetical protein